MKQSFRVSLGAVVLALATLAAVIFAILNFDQRARFESPDDAAVWRDTDRGVEAWRVSTNGPTARAGIRQGDLLLEIGGQPVTRALDVTKRVWRAGLWSQLRYKVERGGDSFETPVILAPAEKRPGCTELCHLKHPPGRIIRFMALDKQSRMLSIISSLLP